MKLYIIRHGLTEYNKARKYQGTLDIPLSEEGVGQIKKADIQTDLIYVSPLTRARQTAELMFASVPQKIVEDIKEMNFGVFEGRSYIEMEKDEQYVAWMKSGCKLQCPNGEDVETFTKRVCNAVEKIIEESIALKRKNVVIVAHGGTQMALLSAFGHPKKAYYDWRCENNCGYVCELDTNTWQSGKVLNVIASFKNGEITPG